MTSSHRTFLIRGYECHLKQGYEKQLLIGGSNNIIQVVEVKKRVSKHIKFASYLTAN